MAKQQKTSTFVWEGINRRGQPAKGELVALNSAYAKAQLRKQGIEPRKVKKAAEPLFGLGGKSSQKIKSSDITFFTRQMATMVKAGVPLVQSFDIVSDSADNKAMRSIISQVRDSVSSGNDFAYALRQQGKYFDDLTCNLIESGEQAGTLQTMLDKVALYKEKSEALKSKMKKAMMYPVITLLVAFAVTIILLVKVVPSFEQMFNNFGAELPAPTQFVVKLSEITQDYYLYVIAILVLGGTVFYQAYKKSPQFRDRVQASLLGLPVFGDLIMKAAVARYARVLSTTFAAGVPLVDALDSVSGAVGNAVYRDAVLSIKDDVASGQQIHSSMKSTKIFPNMIVQMTSIGEESGALDEMLSKAAYYYE
ncbi:type II secretion system F family protein [Thalassolituus sp.]|uniref:type II secretion system F family protein n=1 Tax=Thalassolituus sp. TaxID=2030822 RepID=UPI003519AD4A